jgi:hypothetical protein
MKHKIFKLIIPALGLLGGLCGAVSPDEAFGAESVPTPQSAAKSKKKTTDVSFEDVLVQGKYHFSDEAVTTVEQDNVLDALLGVRTDFKDRLEKSSSRY